MENRDKSLNVLIYKMFGGYLHFDKIFLFLLPAKAAKECRFTASLVCKSQCRWGKTFSYCLHAKPLSITIINYDGLVENAFLVCTFGLLFRTYSGFYIGNPFYPFKVVVVV